MSSTRKIAAATLAVLALAAPAATARPIMDRPTAEPTPAPPIQAAGESFDWSAAGIGAASTAALVLVASGGFAAAHRGSPAKSVS
jgi:hypothetical protein